MKTKDMSTRPLGASKRNSIIQQSISESLEEARLNKMVNEEKIAMEEEASRKEGMQAIQESYARKQAKQDKVVALAEMEKLNFNRILPKAFGMIVYESLPIARDIKQADAKGIYQYCEETFNALLEAEIVDITSSPSFTQYAGVIQHKVENINDKLTMEEIEEILMDLTRNCEPSIKHLTRNVYEKSVEVIDVENKITEVREKLSENDMYHTDDKTLFRKINESAITKYTTESETIDMNTKGIMEMAFAESMLNYTIIECLHTAKLINIDTTNVRPVAAFL